MALRGRGERKGGVTVNALWISYQHKKETNDENEIFNQKVKETKQKVRTNAVATSNNYDICLVSRGQDVWCVRKQNKSVTLLCQAVFTVHCAADL